MLLSYDSSTKPARLSKSFKTTASSSGMKFPFVTPRVGKIAQGLFYRSLLIAGDKVEPNAELQNICVQDIPFVVHEHDPETVEWGEEIKGASGYYHSVLIDGVEYNVRLNVKVSELELSFFRWAIPLRSRHRSQIILEKLNWITRGM